MPSRKPKHTINNATRFLKKWAGPFGFGHYNITLSCLPAEAKGEVWGRSVFNHEEEWATIEVVPDGILPVAQVETLMLHELAHGLLDLSNTSEATCETVCNRIARLALAKPNVVHCNQWNQRDGDRVWNTALLTEPWMKLLVEGLPLRQRTVVNSLFYECQSMRHTAAAMGVSVRTVGRLRERALVSLQAAAKKLEAR